MYQLVVESLEWERIELIVAGRVEELESAEDGLSEEIYLEDARTLDRVLVDAPEVVGDRFRLRFKIMQVDDLYPLVTGSWYFVRENAEGEGVPCARLDESFASDLAAWGGFFTTPTWRYWVVPTVSEETAGFGLDVTYGRAASRPDPASGSRIAAKSHTRLRKMRESIFVGLFDLARDLVPKNGRRMLFTSDSRESLSGNLETIHARMLERGLDERFKIYMSFKPSIHDRRGFLDKFRFTYHLAIADVVVVDDFHPMIYKVRFSPGVKIVQVWHASGAFKTVGYSRIGKPGGPNPFSRAHKAYTHAIVSSEHDRRFYSEAFGIRVENVVPTGIPRMDLFFDDDYTKRSVELVHESIPETRGRKVILFAPTFRGTGPANAYYDYDRLDYGALHALCEERDAVMLIKMHPFVIEPPQIPAEYADRLICKTDMREINELLLVSDVVVTDYSSLVFEYSTLGRPMVFYAYDLDEYISTRDFYEPFEEFVPGRIVRTFDELLDALRNDDYEIEKVAPFAERHVSHLDSGSTDRVIDLLTGE